MEVSKYRGRNTKELRKTVFEKKNLITDRTFYRSNLSILKKHIAFCDASSQYAAIIRKFGFSKDDKKKLV